MSWSRINAIFRKDMREAVRDSRVLTAILVPLLLGLAYSFMLPDENGRVEKIKVGVVADGATQLADAITRQAPDNVRLSFVTLPGATRLEQQVRQEKLDLGLLLPPSFDDAVRDGASPTLTVVLPASPDFDAGYVTAIVERSVQTLAGAAPAARVVQRSLPPGSGDSSALGVLGERTYGIIVSLIMLLGMIAIYTVPAVLIDETEKKTMDALTLIASTTDVIAAKALFGIVLSIVAVPVMLAVVRDDAADVLTLAVAVVLSAVVLVGLGLLSAGLFKTQQQVNTWSGAVLLVLLVPTITVGMPTPDAVNAALWFMPTGHTFRLMANAFAGRAIYPHELLSYAMLVAWAAGVYGFLWWRLSRREDA